MAQLRSACVVCMCCLLLSGVSMATKDLFFIDANEILKVDMDRNEAKLLYEDNEHPQALDFNYCGGDQKIYWTSQLQGRIVRGSPDPGTIEDVISDDITMPRGIAIDYMGSNIYFSQKTAFRGEGRLEVVKCRGEYRKVLQTGLTEAGPITLDITRGYLYYVDGAQIYRIDTNGWNNQRIEIARDEITGLAIDVSLNRLYWCYNGTIMYRNLPDGSNRVQNVSASQSRPYGLSAVNGVLYWTGLGNNSGAIYSLNVSDDTAHPVRLHTAISPLDISISLPESPPLTGGCSDRNGGCNQFCFTVPASSAVSLTDSECSCITGIELNTHSALEQPQCATIPDQFILYGRITSDDSYISMVSLITDVDIPVPVPFQVSGPGAFFIAYDHLEHTVYWDETTPPMIRSAEISSTSSEIFINTDVRSVSGLAVDTFNRNIYWCDAVLDRIEVASISSRIPNDFSDRRVRKVLIDSGIHRPQSLALDLEAGFMYWVDLDASNRRIERAGLDGSGRIELDLPTNLMITPTYLTTDPATGVVYWTDEDDKGDINTNYTAWQRIQGQGYNIDANNVHGLAIVDGQLYWTDGGEGFIGVATISGDRVEQSREFLDKVTGVQGIVAVDTNYHFVTHCNSRVFECSHLCVSHGGNLSACACPDHLQFASGSTTDCIDIPIYAIVAGDRQGPGLDEDDVGPFVEVYTPNFIGREHWDFVDPYISTVVVAIAIHLHDNGTSDLYYINSNDRLIYRLDNISSDTAFRDSKITPIITCCLATPEDLAVDWLASNLYWTDSQRGVIEVSRLDGRARRVLYFGLSRPSLLELDPRRGNLYYVSKGSPSIHYLRMDGSSSVTSELCTHCSVSSDNDIQEVTSLSIDFDPTPLFGDRLSWSYSRSSGTGTVSVSVDLNNITRAPSLIRNEPGVNFTAASYFNQMFYAAIDQRGIFISSLNGNPVLNGRATFFADFVIAHHSKQPGYHECSAEEFCSGYDPLCLTLDHIYGNCMCPIDSFKVIAKDPRGIEYESCTKTNSFLVWATTSNIYYYPLPSDLRDSKMTSAPHVVPRHCHGNVSAVTYDPREENIVWIDSDTQLLHSDSIHGVNSKVLGRFPDHISPDSASLDWIGGQLLFTETVGYQIEAASIRGNGEGSLTVGSVVSAYGEDGGVVLPHRPMDVIFNEQNLTVIWHEEGQRIFQAKLGANRKDYMLLLDYAVDRSIAQLTFDPTAGYLFWWNEQQDTIEGLQVAKVTEGGSADVKTFVSDVTRMSGLFSNTLTNDESFIFWYDVSEEAFYRCDVLRKLENEDFGCREKQLSWSLGGEEMVAMVSFDRRRSSVNTPFICRTGTDIQCDYLCLESEGKAHCKCPLFRDGVGEGESQCADLSCALYHTSCQNGLECFPNTYACDGIKHCTNGFDEESCTVCDDQRSLPCGPGDEGRCYLNSSRCDDVLDCPVSVSDELICCEDFEFGCYSVVRQLYECFSNERKCESDPVCLDRRDQENCELPSSPTPTPHSKSPNTAIIVAVVSVIVSFFFFVLPVTVCIYRLIKVKRSHRQHGINLHANSKPGSLPRPPSEVSSIISGGITSLGTESTNFGNCSSPHAESIVKGAGFHLERSTHISNPPPSLITRQQSPVLDGEVQSYSQSYMVSEVDPCPPPNPSVDWDNMSALSYSASQRGMRLVMMNGRGQGGENSHYQRPPGRGTQHNFHPQAENPLHYHHSHHHTHTTTVGYRGNSHGYHGNGNLYIEHPHHHRADNSVVSETSRHTDGMSDVVHPRIHGNPPAERGGVAGYNRDGMSLDCETETIFSQSTVPTDNASRSMFQFEERFPPGRPNSPATITEYSERDVQVQLSPQSVLSEEDVNEGSKQQQQQ